VHLCLDDHLKGKLHPATLQLQFLDRFSSKAAEATIKIATFLAGKKQAPDPGQKGITEVSVQSWHRVRCDSTPETVSYDQIVTLAKFFNKGKQGRKIVTLVRVSHDHIFSVRRVDSCRQSRAIATGRRAYSSSVQVISDLDGAIGAAIIGHNNFSGDAVLLQKKLRLLNASCQGASLVKAGHDN
jgi:hypothetical protein